MRQWHLAPSPALAPFIDRLWGWDSAPGAAPALPVLLPGTGAELYFHYRDPFLAATADGGAERLAASHLLCVRARPITLVAPPTLGFIAVRFKAGMLPRFTAIPLAQLIDGAWPADQLWGQAGAELEERLALAASDAQRIALIERFLLAQCAARPADLPMEHAARLLYQQGSDAAIDALAQQIGLGKRQFERRWRQYAGQTPSDFRGLVRFQRAVRQLLLEPQTPLLDAALAAGYYDQPHFIHEFRRRTAGTPERLLRAARHRTHFYNPPLGLPR